MILTEIAFIFLQHFPEGFQIRARHRLWTLDDEKQKCDKLIKKTTKKVVINLRSVVSLARIAKPLDRLKHRLSFQRAFLDETSLFQTDCTSCSGMKLFISALIHHPAGAPDITYSLS